LPQHSAKGLSLGNSGTFGTEDAGKRKNDNNLTKWGVASATPTGSEGLKRQMQMDAGTAHNIKYDLIPQECSDLPAALRRAGFPISDILSEITSDENLSEGFDYVVSHLETAQQREKYYSKANPAKGERDKRQLLARLKKELQDGTFRIRPENIREMIVDDGPKVRVVQAPRVYHRIGCHVIMVVVERYVNPTLITNTAASIKGRGMHWLFHRIVEDYSAVPEAMQYYYQNDINSYYDSISQERMKAVIRLYISDTAVLGFLDNFITLLPKGLSKGLRSSQCFANLYLSPVDHVMCCHVPKYIAESGEVRYLYERYMDDAAMWGGEKQQLWLLHDIYHTEVGKLDLIVKKTEAIRPITEGLDYLGFDFFGTHARLRKRTKKKAARHLSEVRSRKRRQEIIGSFKGMACHADCKHLYYKLTHKYMKKFGEMGISYKPKDGKKRFPGKVVPIRAIANRPIEIHDYEIELSTTHGDGRYLVSFKNKEDGVFAKFFTASKEMQNILDQISDLEDGFPFETTIVMEYYDGKTLPKFT